MDRLPAPGIWWTPSKRDEQVYGQLEGEPGTLRLNVIGNLEGGHPEVGIVSTTYFDDLPRIPIIHGMIRGKVVSLLNVRKSRLGLSAPGFDESSYRPDMVVFGRHVGPDETDAPLGIKVHYSHLLAWHGTRGLIGSSEMMNEELLRQAWTYQYPKPFDWNIPRYSISLRGGLNHTHDWDNLHAVEYGYFTVKSKFTKPMEDWVRDIVSPIHEMLKFAIFAPVRLTRIRPLFEDQAANPEFGTLDSYSSDLVINRQELAEEEVTSSKHVDMLFKAEYITDEILENLINPNDRVNQIRSRFLSYEQSPLSPDDFFLAYVRQLESLHRVLFPVPDDVRQRFADRLSIVRLGMSPENDKLLAGRLTYAYEPSLAARLQKLAKPWKTKLASVVGSRELFGREIERIGRQRNFLAHELAEDQRIFKDKELRRATLLLMVLARLAALQQAGFKDSVAEEVVTASELYKGFEQGYATVT